LRLQPQSVAAYNNLASLFLLQGKVEDAVQAYQAALRIAPEDTRARAGLEKALSARP
jgi:cytochrome c-type biogenesis protein CcmH/NrfG